MQYRQNNDKADENSNVNEDDEDNQSNWREREQLLVFLLASL